MKKECVTELPKSFEEKRVGKSWYYEEFFSDNQCSDMKMKKEPVTFIDSGNYLDGTCIKDERGIYGPELFVRYYCEEDVVLVYLYKDSDCT